MPTIDIVKKYKIPESFRIAQVRGMFDYQRESVEHHWKSKLPIEEKEWGIGLIVGASGSGKTTLAKEAFPSMRFHESFEWSPDNVVVDDFESDLNIKDITSMLNSVGLSSPPSWLKPYSVLSNGQKFRAELARCILTNKTGIIFDEFTSVIDRDVAKISCAAISKTLRRKKNPPFIAVSCHYDIIDWLQPDWIFDVGTQQFDWRERTPRPEISVKIHKATTSDWRIFREHHYLDHHIHKAARCFVATINDKPVGFTSVLHFPHPTSKLMKREHRTVVLPDFQGVGIGNKLSEFIANYFRNLGFRFLSVTSAPSMIWHRKNSAKWKIKRFGRVGQQKTGITSFDSTSSKKRMTASFEYIG
tara:strand:+ start:498 stop:1574 length:1077 start_codon:yes stop_codon:yes gene_type:complete